MNKIMLQQYNMLSKDMQQEAQHYIRPVREPRCQTGLLNIYLQR